MQVTPDWSLEPLRCRTCEGRGWVDGTDEYMAQFRPGGTITHMGGEPHSKPCYVCSGTGRHVSRARAGLAAPATYHLDIETCSLADFAEAVSGMKLYPYQKEALTKLEDMSRRGLGFDWPVFSPKTAVPSLNQYSGKSRNPLFIVDDLGPPDTPEQRQKVLEWFQKALPIKGECATGSVSLHQSLFDHLWVKDESS
ncbi:hypothetical protein KIKIMORA_01210 [Brevundimonas phage vB_BpoS-Kikimora]|uniref:Uncharacterized protein n=1 Tax=Brevundimonas phage vB_BpoS-Kikimora TaxID=2948601 RepID=A0A9E7SMR8_9CAUD|nr:hypothetical protein KIKIMORA_01210 [Brevundimonas phage vB_BpoS-Kikimora]